MAFGHADRTKGVNTVVPWKESRPGVTETEGHLGDSHGGHIPNTPPSDC